MNFNVAILICHEVTWLRDIGGENFNDICRFRLSIIIQIFFKYRSPVLHRAISISSQKQYNQHQPTTQHYGNQTNCKLQQAPRSPRLLVPPVLRFRRDRAGDNRRYSK